MKPYVKATITLPVVIGAGLVEGFIEVIVEYSQKNKEELK